MDLSIIIASYNTKDLVIDCINSIYLSKPKIDFELIVVDNASEDGSLEALKSINNKITTIIANNKNLGFAKANNQGIKKAKGKHVLLLNSDTVVKVGSIDNLVDFANKNTDAGVVGSRLLNPNGSIQKSVRHFPTITTAIKEFWLKKQGSFGSYAPKGNSPVEVDVIYGASFLITKAARKKVGLLNESYFMYFEDIDYCKRVSDVGLKVYYLPSSEVVHYHGESGRNIAAKDDQWKRLIPSSKTYHGLVKHYLINAILWSGQKFHGGNK